MEWISVEERLPTDEDCDDDFAVLAIHKVSKKKYYHWRSVADNPFDFTHWMPLPSPPGRKMERRMKMTENIKTREIRSCEDPKVVYLEFPDNIRFVFRDGEYAGQYSPILPEPLG